MRIKDLLDESTLKMVAALEAEAREEQDRKHQRAVARERKLRERRYKELTA